MTTTKPFGTTSRPTLADLDALPPGIVGEIIEGVLYTMTKPRMRHQRTATGIGGDLRGPFDLGRGGPGGWWIVAEPGIELPNTPEISPEVAGWRREHMPEMPVDEPIRVVPDWVCEILSPTPRRHDLLIKLPYYAKVGVAYHWLVDLEAHAVTAQRLESGRWVTIGVYGDDTEARIEPFDVVPSNEPQEKPRITWLGFRRTRRVWSSAAGTVRDEPRAPASPAVAMRGRGQSSNTAASEPAPSTRSR
jgi:Uma2 family endonuclease